MEQKIVYIDMDDVLCDFTNRAKERLAATPEIAYPQSQHGFFTNLDPIEGGIDAAKWFLNHPAFDVYILTAPSTYNPLCYTEKRVWIEDYLGMEMVERLIINPNKGLNKGDYLIDDRIKGSGQESFEGTVIQFGSAQYPDWEAVMRYFTKHYPHESWTNIRECM